MKKSFNVLVTSAGSAPAVAVIKALKRQVELDITVIAVDMDELSSGFYLADKSETIHSSDHPDFLDEIKEICRREKISLIIPIIDEELLVFAREKKMFEDYGVGVLINSPETTEMCKDKYKTYLFCRENSIRAPNSGPALPDLEKCSFNMPAIIKPYNGRGSQSVYTIKDAEDYRIKYEIFDFSQKEYLGQDFIEGSEYTVDIVASPEGEILQAVPRERIVVKAGMVYKGRTVKDSELMDLAGRVAKKAGITGPCNIQFIKNGGDYYLIEINPKFAAGLPLTVNAGVNVPLLLIKMHKGQAVKPQELLFKDNFYMLRYWEEKYFQK